MARELGTGPERVAGALRAAGFANEIVQLPRTARSAVDAAAAIGCDVAQIVKSLVFRGATTDASLLVLTSGANRVDEQKLAALSGQPVARADAAFVRERTGFAIGGVAPIGYAQPSAVYLDRDLLRYDTLWAAAGHPYAVFRVTPDELQRMTGGTVADVAEGTRE